METAELEESLIARNYQLRHMVEANWILVKALMEVKGLASADNIRALVDEALSRAEETVQQLP